MSMLITLAEAAVTYREAPRALRRRRSVSASSSATPSTRRRTATRCVDGGHSPPRWSDAIGPCDVVVAPACVQTAPPFGDVDRPVAGVASTWVDVTARTMALWNVTGLPSVAIPIGFGDDGLPIGMQVAGPALADERCLAVAAAYQTVTDHHRRPPVTPPPVTPAPTSTAGGTR